MRKGENYHKPTTGSRIAVDPIKRIKDIQAVSKLFLENPRNHLLFVMGTNNGLRTGDLLTLKVGDTLMINEDKTGKRDMLVTHKSIYKSLQVYLDALKPTDDEFLFASRKGGRPITMR